jgi:hypothetical protein
VVPKSEPGAPVPIPPVVVPKLGTVPKPELPKVVEVPNGLGLAFAADAPPNNEVWPNPRVDGVDVAVPKVCPAGFTPKAGVPGVNKPVPVVPITITNS